METPMKRALVLLPLLASAGCVVHTHRVRTYDPGPPPPAYEAPPAYQPAPAAEYVPPPAPAPVYVAPAPVEVWYYGQHFVPDQAGGGWCFLDGAHLHDYYPANYNHFDFDGGYYYYR